MSQRARVATEKMIFRSTHAVTGRQVAVTPQNSTMKHLSYARIVLHPETSSLRFSNENKETGLVCLTGKAKIKAAGQGFELERYDSLYVPRDSEIEVSSSGDADLAEFSCEVDGKYPLKFVRYADLAKETGMTFTAGGPSNSRQVSMLLAKNVEAGRLLLALRIPLLVIGRAGHRTSTRRCWRKFTSFLRCPRRHTAFNWSITTNSIQSLLQSYEREMRC